MTIGKKEKIYWEKWTNNSLFKAGNRPIALLIYSSLDPKASALIKDRKLAKILSNFSLIAIDVENQHVYTGYWGGSTYLTQYDINANSESRVDIGSSICGIAV